MIRLELHATDAELLASILEDYLSDLRMEIAGTDSMAFRESLKERKAVLRRIADELSGAARTVPGEPA